MTINGLCKILYALQAGEWEVSKNNIGFVAKRNDSIDMFLVDDLTKISATLEMHGFRTYVTLEPKSPRGMQIAFWFTLQKTVSARTPRKPDRRSGTRRIADKAAQRLKR